LNASSETLNVSVALQNPGSITVQHGTLVLGGSVTSNQISVNDTLVIASSGGVQVVGTLDILSGGKLDIQSGTLEGTAFCISTLTHSVSGQVTSNGTVNWLGGVISGTGQVSVFGTPLVISGSASKSLTSATIYAYAGLNISSNFQMDSSTIINEEALNLLNSVVISSTNSDAVSLKLT
jgi:hypothetical protein